MIKTDLVVDKVKLGDDAVVAGNEIIKSVNEYFNTIKNTFDRTSITLNQQAKMAAEMFDKFSNIQEKTESIALYYMHEYSLGKKRAD